jgi:hypothetical protein
MCSASVVAHTVISAFRRLRQGDHTFKVTFDPVSKKEIMLSAGFSFCFFSTHSLSLMAEDNIPEVAVRKVRQPPPLNPSCWYCIFGFLMMKGSHVSSAFYSIYVKRENFEYQMKSKTHQLLKNFHIYFTQFTIHISYQHTRGIYKPTHQLCSPKSHGNK